MTERATGFPLTIDVWIVTCLPIATSAGSCESVVTVYVVTLFPGPRIVMDCPGSYARTVPETRVVFVVVVVCAAPSGRTELVWVLCVAVV